LANKFEFNIAFIIPNMFNKFIKCGKDVLNPMSCYGVVYKILS